MRNLCFTFQYIFREYISVTINISVVLTFSINRYSYHFHDWRSELLLLLFLWWLTKCNEEQMFFCGDDESILRIFLLMWTIASQWMYNL
jgi:hypothetical protein